MPKKIINNKFRATLKNIFKDEKDEGLQTFGGLIQAIDSIGARIYSDDYCCKLLAAFRVFGFDETVVKNRSLYAALKVAQDRLNIFGASRPNVELTEKFKKYVVEAEESKEPPEWVVYIYNRYDMNINQINWKYAEEEKK